MTQPTDDLLRARYGESVPPTLNAIHPAIASMLGHRSVRAFTREPLEPDTLEQIVAAAQSASNSSNLQSWSVVAVEDPARKERLADLTGGEGRYVRDCPLFLMWIADLARLDAIGERRNLRREGLDYLELLMVSVIDAALAAQNAAVAAEAMGLGIVYVGAMRNQPELVAKELGLPPRAFGVFGMCVGHPDPSRPTSAKPRLPQEAVLHRERYNLEAISEPTDRYAEAMGHYYRRNNMKINGNDWAEHSLHRVRGAEALNSRDRLKQALTALGFPAH